MAVGLALAGCSGSNVPVNNADQIAPSAAVSDSSAIPAAVQYRDGSYTARGVYGSLPSHQDVTLTLDRGAVTTIEITTPAQDQTSLGYQQRFAAALPNAVIGRNIDELNIDRLAGSSGCSEGFMKALERLKETLKYDQPIGVPAVHAAADGRRIHPVTLASYPAS
ncbi:hypothetical protein [Arthrobacter sp. ISL-5]|uniref:hypothetical protein n=1 Tax=Arthrobacter sp. ISL-5 TaxID=2819111 RepID=UPI001BE5B8C9|nr:hypothetical protein [Arthrobacter sp. ISL-5]MBT2556048.1 hypothetical protein [Arthrobacter sp. ISL-5]